MTNLWNDNYDAKCDYIFNRKIVEYDIEKANISVLYDNGRLSESEYTRLLNQPRMVRQYEIGCAIRDDPKLEEVLDRGFRNARQQLVEKLNLEDQNILHVNRDALFIVLPKITRISDRIQIGKKTAFTCRGVYDSYYRIDPIKNIHMYFSYPNGYKVRGIGESALKLHEEFFLKDICHVMNIAVFDGIQAAYRALKDTYTPYARRKVDYRCYRRFDSQSLFDIIKLSDFSSFQAEYINSAHSHAIDISHNLMILNRIGNFYLSALINHDS